MLCAPHHNLVFSFNFERNLINSDQISSSFPPQDDEVTDSDDEERHVGFSGDLLDNPENTKLRRRDTPHHLKNKRINFSSSKDGVEDAVREILAKAKGSGSIVRGNLLMFISRFICFCPPA